MTMKQTSIADTSAFSSFYEMHKSELGEVSDDSVNAAYNFFDAERMKYYHNVYVKTDRNFRNKKTEKPNEWNNFESVIRICKKNGFHLRCYIKYCFINKLVPKARGKILSDIEYLRNYPQVIGYAKNKTEIERLYKIYMSINKTIFLVKKMCQRENCDAKTEIKRIISSGKLTEYISTGTISQYFLSLIHNISVMIKMFKSQDEDDSIINDMCSRMEKYGKDSVNALKMFYPSSLSKTIIELCSE